MRAAGDRGCAERVALAWAALAAVEDPEIPALSIVDLGLIRFVTPQADGTLEVGLSPTYVGCPATEVIRRSVEEALADARVGGFAVTTCPVAGLDQRLDHAPKAGASSNATASCRREHAAASHAGCAARRPAGGLSALPLDRHRMRQRIWIDALQGAASLPRLSRTLRILQVHLMRACLISIR